MFLKSRKRHTTLAMGFVCLSLCGCQPTEQAAEPTAGKTFQPTAKLELTPIYIGPGPKAALEELDKQAERMKKSRKEKQQRILDHRRGCLDEQSDAYLQLPLKVVDPAFRPCGVNLLRLTRVPLMLPPDVSALNEFRKATSYAYFEHPFISTDQYSIGVSSALIPSHPFRENIFTGEIIMAKSPTLKEQFEKRVSAFANTLQFDSGRRKQAGPVTLVNGVEGYYFPGVCGANCHEVMSSVTWDQDDYRYSINMTTGNKEKLLEIVNAAIENQAD
jgi:hypothetical protein